MLLMLEDNAERLQSCMATLRQIDPNMPLHVWRNAHRMIEEMSEYLGMAHLISLDHDLDPEEGSQDDPGTGWELVKVLAALPPVCPVIVHTSNGERYLDVWGI